MSTHKSIVGLESLFEKLDGLSGSDLDNIIGNSVARMSEQMRSDVSDSAPVNPVDGGELRRSFFAKVDKVGSKYVGTVFSAKDYALYVELGTGPHGRDNHDGISPHVNPHYRNTPWVIPFNAMTEIQANAYGLPPVYKNGQISGYATHGMKANPFIYQTYKVNEKAYMRLFNEQLKFNLKRYVK